jgi:hypothetical protein
MTVHWIQFTALDLGDPKQDSITKSIPVSRTQFLPGFRFSAMDAVVLCLGAATAWFLGSIIWWAGVAVIFVVGHFFLFCNVFRIARGSEYTWAGAFVLLAACTLITEQPGWPGVFMVCLGLSTFLIWRETRKKDYHGIFWQRWNPGLQEWWEHSR